MNKKKWLGRLSGLLILSLLVLTGCESVSGLNLNKALQSSVDMESYEGKASISLELLLDEQAEQSGLEANVLGMLQNFTIDMYEVKQQDLQTMSVKGSLVIGEQSIPFELSIDQEQMVIHIEGIERPLVVKTGLPSDEWPFGLFTLDDLSSLNQELSRSVLGYVLPNAPNPPTIEVERANVEINKENLNLHKVHAVLYGDEMVAWAKALLQNLAKDEEGLRTLLSELYDLVLPMIDEMIQEANLNEDDYASSLLISYLHNKTLVVEFLFTTIHEGYNQALKEFDTIVAELEKEQEAAGIHVLNRDSHFDVQVYVDSALRIRKAEMELVVKPQMAFPLAGFEGVRVNMSQEIWNLNHPVTADIVDSTDGLEFSGELHKRELLSEVDPQSALADWLRGMGLDQNEINVIIGSEDEENEWTLQPYVVNQTVLVNGYWFAGQLGLELEWNEDENLISILDPVSDQTLILSTENNSALLNGETIELRQGAEVKDYYRIFIPLRVVAETFGAEVEYDAETKMIVVTQRYF